MRTRFAVTWLIAIGTLVVGAGVVAASSGYRRITAQEGQVARLRAELESRGVLVVTLTDEVGELRQRLGASRLTAQAAADEVSRLRRQLKLAQDEMLQLDDRATAQRGEIEVLATCLGGTLHALHSLAGGDRFGALQHLVTVDGACRAAYRLLNVQPSVN
jgi:chromosome segregation ATPase